MQKPWGGMQLSMFEEQEASVAGGEVREGKKGKR